MTIDAAVEGDNKAEVAEDGRILVNGEEIYLNYTFDYATWSSAWTDPVTTEVASVSEDGKTITYKGDKWYDKATKKVKIIVR